MSDEENYILSRQPGWREESQLRKQKAPSELAPASGSDAAWKTLALRLSEEAQTCLDNAHWEVRFGSGDMLKTIKAIRLMAEVEAAEHLNAEL